MRPGGSWWGAPDLLAHIISVAVAGLERCGVANPPVAIDVTVGNDIEHFTSSRDFLDSVTVDALRHWHVL